VVFIFLRLSGLCGHTFSAFAYDCQILMEKLYQRALYRVIILAVCFGLDSSTGLAGPQPAYLKITYAAHRDRVCKSAFMASDTR